MVQGKTVTGFTNSEKEAVGLTEVFPFLVEDMLKQNDGKYSKRGDWEPHVVSDGRLITGQNLVSSEPAAKALLEKLSRSHNRTNRGQGIFYKTRNGHLETGGHFVFVTTFRRLSALLDCRSTERAVD